MPSSWTHGNSFESNAPAHIFGQDVKKHARKVHEAFGDYLNKGFYEASSHIVHGQSFLGGRFLKELLIEFQDLIKKDIIAPLYYQ